MRFSSFLGCRWLFFSATMNGTRSHFLNKWSDIHADAWVTVLGDVCVEHCPLPLLQVNPTWEGTYDCLYCFGIAEFTGSLFSWIMRLSGNKFYEKRRNPEPGRRTYMNRLGLNSILVRVFLRIRNNRSTNVNRQKKKFILRYWLNQLQTLGESKLWQEIQERIASSKVVSLEIQEEQMMQFRSEGHPQQHPLLLRGSQSFDLFKLLIRWCPPTLWRELLYSKSNNLNVHLIQTPSQKQSDSHLTRYLDTVAQLWWHIKLIIISRKEWQSWYHLRASPGPRPGGSKTAEQILSFTSLFWLPRILALMKLRK